MTFSASRPPTPMAITPSASTCGVWLSVPTQVSGNATPSIAWITGDIFSRLIWCMMPLPAGITSTLSNARLRPLDEVKAVFVATVLDRAVLLERLRVEAAVLDRERVVDDELYRHDRVHLGRVAALVCDGIAQSSEIDQRGLAQDVVADDAGREPREVAIAPAVGDLLQALVENRRVAAAHEILRVHARGVRQLVPGAGTDRVDRCACVEVVEGRAGKRLAMRGVHGRRFPISASPAERTSDLRDRCSSHSGE